MAKLNLKKFLVPHAELTGFQTRVETGLLGKVNDLRKDEGLSWQELIEALFRAYIAESKKEKSHV